MVNRTMRLHHNQPHALIETLNAVQESFGFLDEDVLRYVALSLRVPLSRVYAVATFYHSFAPGRAHLRRLSPAPPATSAVPAGPPQTARYSFSLPAASVPAVWRRLESSMVRSPANSTRVKFSL